MTVPSKVNFVGMGTNLYSLGYQFNGSAMVITRYLRNAWLWDRVRVQGGAYGAFCLFDRLSGTLTFVSYRDPNLGKTLSVFKESADYLRDLRLSHEELSKAIVGAIGDIDKYMLPDAKGYAAMLRHLTNDSDEVRQQMRHEVLNTEADHFPGFGRILKAFNEAAVFKVLGSSEAIESANLEQPGWFHVLKVI
jgi:Zn-dependent M16 (insulinase) family peptidase